MNIVVGPTVVASVVVVFFWVRGGKRCASLSRVVATASRELNNDSEVVEAMQVFLPRQDAVGGAQLGTRLRQRRHAFHSLVYRLSRASAASRSSAVPWTRIRCRYCAVR